MRGLLVSCVLVLACKPAGGGAEGTTSEAATGTSSSGDASGEPTSGTSTSGASTTGVTSLTTLPATSESSEAMTGESSESSESGEPITSGEGGGTTEEPGPPMDECEVDADCQLHDDCCTCAGVPAARDPEVCDERCDESLCSQYGVSAAVCRFGVCEAQRLSCDASKIACDGPEPDCGPGMLAETTPTCWTGACVPAALCDVVPDCAWCGDGQFCVEKVAFVTQATVCEPLPAKCLGTSSCNCVADLVCLDPYTACFQQEITEVSCQCPDC